MLIESGRVIAVEPTCLWVETVKKSTCGSCSAKAGCGQSLLAKLGSHPGYLRVLLTEKYQSTEFAPGDQVEIGVPESVVVNGSLFVYLLPLVTFILGAALGDYLFGNETLVILLSFAGLLLGGALVRGVSVWSQDRYAYQPIVVGFKRLECELVQPVAVISNDGAF